MHCDSTHYSTTCLNMYSVLCVWAGAPPGPQMDCMRGHPVHCATLSGCSYNTMVACRLARRRSITCAELSQSVRTKRSHY